MARDHARVNLTIWTDPDFRALPPAAQHLYLTLWTAPELSYCGVHDWRPARLTGLSRGYTAEHLETVAACLEARHFFVIDHATEECLVRSWPRFDGIMKQPRMAISLVHAYASVGSQTIREVLVYEVRKIREESPGLSCWADKRIAEMLEHPAMSAKELPPISDPFGDGFTPSLALGLPQTETKVWGSVCTPSTPAPTPATNSLLQESASTDVVASSKASGRKRPSSPFPDDFEPNETNRTLAAEKNLDLDAMIESFKDWHLSKDSRFADWQRALGTWLRREKGNPAPKPVSRIPHVSELEQPPDGLSPDEYAQWDYERRQKRARA